MAKQIEVSRTFEAPINLVWAVWTDPDLVMRWWGPKHFSAPVARMDFRVGGTSLVSMKAPPEMGGQQYYSIWRYVRIELHQTIEFMQHLSDSKGNPVDPTSVGMPPDFPPDIRTIVSFEEIAPRETRMTVKEYAEFASMSHFAQLGLEQSIEKMAAIFA